MSEQDLSEERHWTPLHLASFSGSEDAVRLLLNCAGIDVESPSYPSGYIPLHLACLSGHIGVVGLLLSRSTELLKVYDENDTSICCFYHSIPRTISFSTNYLGAL